MQRSLKSLSLKLHPVCRFILYPTNRFVSLSIHVLAPTRKEYFVSLERGVCSVLLNSHRNYSSEAQRSGKRLRNGKENDVVARNRKIISFGKEGNWREILRLVENEEDQLNNVNWATAFSQLGRVRNLDRHDRSFQFFVNEYAACLRDGGIEHVGIREIANVVYTIGKMQLKNPATKRILDFIQKEENVRRIVQGETRDVANVAWSFAALGVPSAEFFAEIENCADWFVSNGNAQDIANTAWSCATLGVRSPKIFAAIEKRAEWLLMNGKPQEIANVAWSFARLGVSSPKLFAAIEHHANWLVQNGQPQNVSNIAWAFATLAVPSHKFFVAIETRAEWLVTNGKPQEVSNVAWAFASLDLQAPKLFTAIENRIDWLMRNGNKQTIANIVWASAKLNINLDVISSKSKMNG